MAQESSYPKDSGYLVRGVVLEGDQKMSMEQMKWWIEGSMAKSRSKKIQALSA